MPNASAFFLRLRPIPPMPRIPRIFPWGSWPSGGGGEPLKCPSRRAIIAVESHVSYFVEVGGRKWGEAGTSIESTQGSENKKHVRICRGIIHRRRNIRNSYIVSRASMNVYLIVSGS